MSGQFGIGFVTIALMFTEQERLERRQRREERRERQRALNLVRAKQMHEARLAIPPSGKSFQPLPGVYAGCSGWRYWHWKGAFYPSDLPDKDWFKFYATKFRTVELNAPFYSWPGVATVKTWLRQAAGRRFIYTIKVNELITHLRKFSRTKALVDDFGLIADLLGERMGCFLFQLPPSVHYSARMLRKILSQLDKSRRNVVEFRHRSWWNETVYRAFRDSGTIFCSTSGPQLPDELVKTADDIYVRFHGIKQWYRHDYTREELAIWADRIRASGAKRTWCYFNNDRDGYAIKNARQLLRLLKN